MNKKQLEKKLKNQIDKATPCNFDDVYSKCENTSTSSQLAFNTSNKTIAIGSNKNKIIAFILSCIIILSVIFAVIPLFNKNGLLKPSFDGYFLIDINPSIEVSYDKNGIVTNVKGLNKDGEAVVLSINYQNKNYEQITTLIVEKCEKLGYFSKQRQDNAILISANGNNGEKDTPLTSEIEKILSKKFVDSKIKGVVITGVVNEALSNQALSYNIDAQKYALIKEYLSLGGEIQESEYQSVTIKELYSFISSKKQQLASENLTSLEFELLFKEIALQGVLDSLNSFTTNFINQVEIFFAGNNQLISAYRQVLDQIDLTKSQITSENFDLTKCIISQLDSLKLAESNSILTMLIEDIYNSLQEAFNSYKEVAQQIFNSSSSAVELSEKRSSFYSNLSFDVDVNFDFKLWQQQNKDNYVQNWYDLRFAWQKDRNSEVFA